MRDARDVILRPVVSEKSYGLLEANVYTFVVAPDASKPEIHDAVELIFGVTVKKVNTLNRKGKAIRNRKTVDKMLVLVFEARSADELSRDQRADKSACDWETSDGQLRPRETLVFRTKQGPRLQVDELTRVGLHEPGIRATRRPLRTWRRRNKPTFVGPVRWHRSVRTERTGRNTDSSRVRF